MLVCNRCLPLILRTEDLYAVSGSELVRKEKKTEMRLEYELSWSKID